MINKSFFELFNYWCLSHPDQVFIFDRANRKQLKLNQFLEIVNSLPKMELFENKIIICKLERTVDSFAHFFALLKSGNSILLDNDSKMKSRFWKGGELNLDGDMVNKPIDFKLPDQCIWTASSGTTKEPTFWPHSVGTLLGNIFEHVAVAGKIPPNQNVLIGFETDTIIFIRSLFTFTFGDARLDLECLPKGLDISNIFSFIEEHNINILLMPPIYLDLIYQIGRKQNRKLPCCLNRIALSGDLVKPNSYRRFSSYFSFNPNIYYGAVETGPVAYLKGDDYYDFGLGSPVGCSISLNENGNIVVSSKFLSPALENQTFVTSDLGQVGSDNKIQIIGRSDSRVTVNGKRFSLGEIENDLYRNQGVESVKMIIKCDQSGTYSNIIAELVLDDSSRFDEIKKAIRSEYPEVMPVLVGNIKTGRTGKVKRVIT